MSTYLVCPICGRDFECKGPHEGPHDLVKPVQDCPLKKGAIYVFVKDDLGQGIPKVKVYCAAGSSRTDTQGFAFFEQLDVDKYSTRIVLEESGKSVIAGYYPSTRISVPASVEKGKITMVEFALNRYAEMLVKMVRSDEGSDLPKATFEISCSKYTPEENSKAAVEGEATFKKLRPTEFHTVKCKVGKDDAKNFQVENDEETGIAVDADKTTGVIFRVKQRFWVDLALVHNEDEGLMGTFALEHKDVGTLEAKDVSREIKHVPNLKAGKIDIHGVNLAESREFVSIT